MSLTCRSCPDPALPGGSWCAACVERRARKKAQSIAWQKAHPATHLAYVLAYQANNRAAGRCAKCGRPAVRGRIHCSACAERARARAAAYRERNKATGLCVKCGGPAVHGKTQCIRCAERQRAKDRARAERRAGAAPRPGAALLDASE